MSERCDGAGEVLARLRQIAELDGEAFGLRNEYERWKLRFELLAAATLN